MKKINRSVVSTLQLLLQLLIVAFGHQPVSASDPPLVRVCTLISVHKCSPPSAYDSSGLTFFAVFSASGFQKQAPRIIRVPTRRFAIGGLVSDIAWVGLLTRSFDVISS